MILDFPADNAWRMTDAMGDEILVSVVVVVGLGGSFPCCLLEGEWSLSIIDLMCDLI